MEKSIKYNQALKTLFCVFLLFHSMASFSQGKYGFEAGVGYTTYNKSYLTTAFQVYWLGRLTHTFYFGGAIAFQRLSMKYSNNPSAASLDSGTIFNIRQKSDYLFFTPRIEMGIGRYKHLFVNLSMGPGIYLGGNQWTHENQPFSTSSVIGYIPDTVFINTSNNIQNLIFRFTGGFKQRFTTYSYWNIVVSEEFSYIPGKISRETPDFKTNYFTVTVGIMHKYPSTRFEED